jgi:NAD+ kinase
MTSNPAIHFLASPHHGASDVVEKLRRQYGDVAIKDADVVVVLGGDGFMLRALHHIVEHDLPVYGMKLGNIGFLMNRFHESNLVEHLEQAEVVELNPLCMWANTEAGDTIKALAINEVSLLRQTNQAAHIRILVNGKVKVEELVCDGVLLATAAGSTAYNLSVSGPILPLGTEALALTPISPFRPRRWHGAILPSVAKIRFEILDYSKRPVSATADAKEVRDIISVDVFEEKSVVLRLMFDPDHSLEQRIVDEQFL